NQIRVGAAALQCHLLTHWRHRFPGVEYMRHMVPGEAVEILGSQPIAIAQFYGIGPAGGDLPKELIQVSDKITPMLVIGLPKTRELEHEQTDIGTDRFTRLQEAFREKLGIEEILIRFPGKVAKTIEVRKFFHGDGIGHFEPEEKIFRHLIRQAFQVLLAGEGIIGGIDANRLEDFRIFAEAIPVETTFRKFPVPLVAYWVIQRAAPTRIFPRRRADKHALDREIREALLHLFALKLHFLIMR